MAEFLYRIGGFASRRSGIVIVAWVAILALAGVAFAVGGGHLANGLSIPGTPTAEVTERLATEFPAAAGGNGSIVFRTEDGKPFTDAQKAAITARIGAASDIDGVTQVVDPFATQAARDAQAQQTTAGQAQLDQASAQLDQGQAQLDAARAQAKASGTLDQAAAGLAAKQAELDQGKAQLDAQRSKLEAGAALLADVVRDPTRVGGRQCRRGTRHVHRHAVRGVARHEERGPGCVRPRSRPRASRSISRRRSHPASRPSSGAAKLVGLVIAAIVLIVMLGTLVGAGLPILSALVGVGIGVLAALSLSGIVEMVSVTPVLGVMLGLAVGIDYSLFIVNRHRRQLQEGYGLRESIGLATGTSGNAVVFAGLTVIVALLALNVTGIPFLGRDGHRRRGLRRHRRAHRGHLHPGPARADRASASSTVASAPRACRRLAPASRSRSAPMSTRRAIVTRRARRRRAGRCWPCPRSRCGSACPTARPKPAGSTQYRRTTTSPRSSAPGSTARSSSSPTSRRSPTGTRSSPSRSASGRQLAAFDDVVAVAPIGDVRRRHHARLPGRPLGRTEQRLDRAAGQGAARRVAARRRRPRSASPGRPAATSTSRRSWRDALPLYLAARRRAVASSSWCVVFRSLLRPADRDRRLRPVAASRRFGGGRGDLPVGLAGAGVRRRHTGPILNFLPTILVGILFGLAMDYMLFLASGMREAYVHGAPARTAVVLGVPRRPRPSSTAAAIIMVSVFGGFIFSESAIIRPIGFALAFGVLVDAFVVRMLLVPALMHLAGDCGVVAAPVARPPHPERRRRGRVPRTAPPARGIGAHRVRGRRDRAGGVSRRPSSRGSGVTTDES